MIINWSKSQWQTIISRRGHTSTVTSSGLVLVGGYGSTTTLELLGSGALSMSVLWLVLWPWFSDLVTQLSEPRAQHCSISISTSTMILTGGDIYGYETSVTEYSNLFKGGNMRSCSLLEDSNISGDAISKQLPPLLKGRSMHACGR